MYRAVVPIPLLRYKRSQDMMPCVVFKVVGWRDVKPGEEDRGGWWYLYSLIALVSTLDSLQWDVPQLSVMLAACGLNLMILENIERN